MSDDYAGRILKIVKRLQKTVKHDDNDEEVAMALIFFLANMFVHNQLHMTIESLEANLRQAIEEQTKAQTKQ